MLICGKGASKSAVAKMEFLSTHLLGIGGATNNGAKTTRGASRLPKNRRVIGHLGATAYGEETVSGANQLPKSWMMGLGPRVRQFLNVEPRHIAKRSSRKFSLTMQTVKKLPILTE